MKLYGAISDPKDLVTKEYVDTVDSRVDVLWDAMFTEITSNPFQITFETLDGVTVTTGIWNDTLYRLEC